MKGFLAVCLALAPEMARGALSRPIHLAFSYDEEVGCVGARGLVKAIAGRAVRPEACFVGEPTGMGVVVGHKAKRSVRVTVRGLTRHSSLAPQGVNAVEAGARLVAAIAAIGERFRKSGRRDPLYDVPHTTTHVGIVQGGTALNIVPDECEIVFEVRAVGGDDPDAVVAEIEAHARAALQPAMRAIAPLGGVRLRGLCGLPGLDIAPEAPAVSLAKALCGRNDHAKVSFGTEAGLFQEVAGVPTVVVGPGSIAQAHTADEWIDVAQLESCAGFVGRLIERCRA